MASRALERQGLAMVVPRPGQAATTAQQCQLTHAVQRAAHDSGTDRAPLRSSHARRAGRPYMTLRTAPAQRDVGPGVGRRQADAASLCRHLLHDSDTQAREAVTTTCLACPAPRTLDDGPGDRTPLVTLAAAPAELGGNSEVPLRQTFTAALASHPSHSVDVDQRIAAASPTPFAGLDGVAAQQE